MSHFKTIILAVVSCYALAACSSPPTRAQQVAAHPVLTKDQEDVLANGVDPDGVYDAVDGAKVAVAQGSKLTYVVREPNKS